MGTSTTWEPRASTTAAFRRRPAAGEDFAMLARSLGKPFDPRPPSNVRKDFGIFTIVARIATGRMLSFLDCLIYARSWQVATQIIPIPARKIGNHRGHGCSASNSIVAPACLNPRPISPSAAAGHEVKLSQGAEALHLSGNLERSAGSLAAGRLQYQSTRRRADTQRARFSHPVRPR
jgi:hypothetical protein